MLNTSYPVLSKYSLRPSNIYICSVMFFRKICVINEYYINENANTHIKMNIYGPT